ncbi:MAG: FecR domain-containing protein [Rhodocyclaceae bacterium]|nr:FecR domain-containing protein [Rhodocyclaceae bacterium]
MKTILSFFAFLLAGLSLAWAAPSGEVTHLSGTLSVLKADGSSKLLSVKSQIAEGDVLTTEADSYARIKFVDGAEVVLRPNTRFKVERYRFEEGKPEGDNVFVSLLKGGLRTVTGLIAKRNKDKVAYQTPTATIGIRGTHFGALFCQGDCGELRTAAGDIPANGLHVDVAAGAISLTNNAGSFEFAAGQFAFVPDALRPPELVPPERAIRVTMPSAIATNRGLGDGIGARNSSECSVE